MALSNRKWLIRTSAALLLLGSLSALWLWHHRRSDAALRQAEAVLDAKRVDAALDAAESPDHATRRLALWTLALGRHPDGYESLSSAAALEADPELRQIAVIGLGFLADPRARRVLERALWEKHAGLSDDAAWALSRLPDAQGAAALAERWKKSDPVGPAFGSTLALGLAHAQGPAAASAIITGQLSHAAEWGEAHRAHRILADVLNIAKSPRVLELLLRLEVYQDPVSAATVAARAPGCVGIPYLVGKYVDPGEAKQFVHGQASVTSAVEDELARMTEPCVPDQLFALLQTGESAAKRRRAAIWLRQFGGRALVSRLGSLPPEQDPSVKAALEETLRLLAPVRLSTQPHPQPPLSALDPFDPGTGPALAKALAQASGADRLPVLAAMASVYGTFGNDGCDRRQRLLERLAEVGFPKPQPVTVWLGPAEVDSLARGLLDADPKIVDATWRVIALLGDHRFLRPVLERADALPAKLLIRAELRHWARTEDVRQLAELARGGSPRVRALVAESLGMLTSEQARGALEALFEDTSVEVRAQAYLGYAKAARPISAQHLALRLAQAPAEDVGPLLRAVLEVDGAMVQDLTLEALGSSASRRADAASQFVLGHCYFARGLLFAGLNSPSAAVRERSLSLLERCYSECQNSEFPHEAAAWRQNARRALQQSDRARAGRVSCVLACGLGGQGPYEQALQELRVNDVWLDVKASGSARARDCASRLLAAVGDEAGLLTLVNSILTGDDKSLVCAQGDVDCVNANYYMEASRLDDLYETLQGRITPALAKALERRLAKAPSESERQRLRELIESGTGRLGAKAPDAGAAPTASSPAVPKPCARPSALSRNVYRPFLSEALVKSDLLSQFLVPARRSKALIALAEKHPDQALGGLIERHLASLLPGDGADVLAALAESNRTVSSTLVLPHVGDDEAGRSALTLLGRTHNLEAIVALLVAPDVPTTVRSSIEKEWGDAAGTLALTRALTHVNARVRQRAASYLGRVGGKSAVEPLLLALDDTNPEVRTAAAEALGTLGDARASASLAQLVLRSPRQGSGYDEALAAWVRLRGAPALAVLDRSTRDADGVLAVDAKSVLERAQRYAERSDADSCTKP